MIGIGVMLSHLGGNADSVAAYTGAIGKKIAALALAEDDALHFTFEDGSKIRVFDDGQSCCESRYMRTDDDLGEFIGSTFKGAEIKDAPNIKEADDDGWGEEHEVQFLEIQTDKGVFTMASHNEHNGYYGGFSIRVETV